LITWAIDCWAIDCGLLASGQQNRISWYRKILIFEIMEAIIVRIRNIKMSIDELVDRLIDNLCTVDQLLGQDKQCNGIPPDKAKILDPLLARLRYWIKKNLPPDTGKQKANINCYCYVCKVKLWAQDMRHGVYNNMCWLCGNINFSKRNFKKDLTGKTAIVSGGRVKIGFETAIRLLRNNCTVIVTSRFVDDCLERYQKDPEFKNFSHRFSIYQLNMLDGANITKFIKYIFDNFSSIDYLINNAAQTIKRPKQFFNHLLDKFQENLSQDSDRSKHPQDPDRAVIVYRDHDELKLLGMTDGLLLLGYNDQELAEIFPKDARDIYGQQIDLRNNNSWILEPDQVSVQELAEVYIINSIAPYMITTKLGPLMTKKNKAYSWIINVTSMEGVFNWNIKPSRHPHTNMAKAALNMFTRTCGQFYIKSNIIMICVDTGWNNSQYPDSYDVVTPIDCADGAARILDPIYRELKEHSIMYKDFEPRAW
jgi:NAD(P)-dependent dehydrogenase (short-subunit alcohol dehydrogenase family)